MTLALEHLHVGDSRVARVDPRWKIACLVPAAVVVALLRTVPSALTALSAAVVLVVVGQLPARWYLSRIGLLALVLSFFVVWLPFFHEQGPHWQLGPLALSQPGMLLAALVVLKGVTVVTLMLVLWATAPLDANLKAAHALRVPAVVIHLLMLTYRYLFLIGEELGRIRIALRVRGYRNRMNLHSYRTAGHVAGTLLVRSYERAERVSHAMRCRGFDGRFRALVEFRTRAGDVAFFLVVAAGAAALLWWDFALRQSLVG